MVEQDDGASHASTTADDLLRRCTTLWTELETFKDHLKQQKREHTLELSHYRGVVKSELKNLERLAEKSRNSSEEISGHSVASSNLPFLECVWSNAKSSTGLVALQKRYYYGDIVKDRRVLGTRAQNKHSSRHVTIRKGKTLVDVVTKDGLEWIKVSLVTNHRMLMEKAREGWVGDSSDSDDEDSEDGNEKSNGSADDPDSGVPIVKTAESLVRAAETVRIRTQHPKIRIVLPRIVEDQQPEIDAILARVRSLGIFVETSDVVQPALSLEQVLEDIITDPLASLTPTLNIDCTILLALVSDFSHCAVSAEPWFHRALKRQVEIEDKENLLPNMLFPALCGRKLECTREAAKRMREIVETIGTEGEKLRTRIIMDNEGQKDQAQLRVALQEWSKFEIPEDFQLPFTIVDKVCTGGKLPPVANAVEKSLTAINQSVFLHGWATGNATITSNRTVVKQIENILSNEANSEAEWPNIWLCPTARSLVGKEKGRRD